MNTLQNCTVTAMVTNLDAAVNFYTNSLGLKLKQRYGEHYAEIEGPGLLLGLHPGGQNKTFSDNLSIGFGVTDFDETVTGLGENGVSVRVVPDGWSRIGHFNDPDGNALYVIEMKA